MVTPQVEQFTMNLLNDAGISVSESYKNSLAEQVERRIAIAITEKVDARMAVDLERALVFHDAPTIRNLIATIPGIQDTITRELAAFRSEYLQALHA